MFKAEDFQNEDYIKYQCDNVLKITDAQEMVAVDVEGNVVPYNEGCCPNIPIDETILEICGFKNVEGEWRCKLGDSLIRYKDDKCTIRIPYKNCIEEDWCTLSILQDFVRTKIGEELPIDHKKLAEYIKNRKQL